MSYSSAVFHVQFHIRARVCAEESEVVASASGIMFSRAIGLPENMLRTVSGLE